MVEGQLAFPGPARRSRAHEKHHRGRRGNPVASWSGFADDGRFSLGTAVALSNMPVKRTKAVSSRSRFAWPGPRGPSDEGRPPRGPGSATIDQPGRPSPLTGKALARPRATRMEPTHHLGPIDVKRRRGDESFHHGSRDLRIGLSEFWQWSFSDLVSNATRGVLAEYLVAQALGVAGGVREEWAAFDLAAADGTRIEVKSAAYIQSWHQERLSKITFRVPKTRAWNRETNRQSQDVRRQADVYVFALLAHKDQSTLDPLDVAQWEFFAVPTLHLDGRKRSQHSITLPSLQALAERAVTYSELKGAVERAAQIQRRLANMALNATVGRGRPPAG